MRWSLRAFALADIDLRWDVLGFTGIVGQTIELRWDIAALAGQGIDLRWNVGDVLSLPTGVSAFAPVKLTLEALGILTAAIQPGFDAKTEFEDEDN